MTHTNHRQGSRQSLHDDYVVLVMPAKGYNDSPEAPEKLKIVFDILISFQPVNAGGINAGNLFLDSPEQIRARIGSDTPMIHGVYTDIDTVRQVIEALREVDSGFSVVVTGLIDEIAAAAYSAGAKPHSIAYSLGIKGNEALLPPPYVQEVTAMCGHNLIPSALVEDLIDKIAQGQIKMAGAVSQLGEYCVCGVFNPVRAARLLERAVSLKKGEKTSEA